MEMFLFGAGASVEAGVPSAFGMTSSILDNLRSDNRLRKHAHVLSFVVGGLIFDGGIKNQNPFRPEINVEDLFNAVQLLGERKTLEAAPFIGSWHSFVEELDKIYPPKPTGSLQKAIYESVSKELQQAFSQKLSSFASSAIDKTIERNINQSIEAALKGRSTSYSSYDSVGRAVEKYIAETVSKWVDRIKRPSSSFDRNVDQQVDKAINANLATSGEGRIFQETNRYMIAALKDLVWLSDQKKVKYLSPCLKIFEHQDSFAIATLNYDNSIELLCESFGIACHTGIEQWSKGGKIDFEKKGVKLIKLHGSIDWGKVEGRVTGTMPTPNFEKIPQDKVMTSDFVPAVIFGNKNKLTAEGPYLDLLREFALNLDSSDKLTVVGYSFRDMHINVYISNWLNTCPSHRLTVINGKNFTSIRELHEAGDYVNDLMRFAQTNEGRVSFVDEYAGDGLLKEYGIYSAVQQVISRQEPKSAMAEMLEVGLVENFADTFLDDESDEPHEPKEEREQENV